MKTFRDLVVFVEPYQALMMATFFKYHQFRIVLLSRAPLHQNLVKYAARASNTEVNNSVIKKILEVIEM